MRRILLTFMAIAAVLSLVACSFGNNANASSSTQESSVTSEAASNSVVSSNQPSFAPDETSELDDTERSTAIPNKPKTLIVYYSLTGTTKAAADIVHQNVESDIFEITIVDEYPTAHDDTITRVDKDRNEGKLPELRSKIENINDYDTIFIGYPIWRGTYADPIAAFLKEYDLSGKTIVPFSTSGSTTLGTSVLDLQALQSDTNVLDGLAVPGSDSQREITTWLGDLGI